jgi:hypothetical protein
MPERARRHPVCRIDRAQVGRAECQPHVGKEACHDRVRCLAACTALLLASAAAGALADGPDPGRGVVVVTPPDEVEDDDDE